MPNSSLANDTTPIIENKQSTNLSMPIQPTSVLKYEYGIFDSTASNINSNVSNATISMQQTSTQLTEAINATSISSISLNSIDAHRRKRSMSSILPASVAPTSPTTTTINNDLTQITLQSTNAKSQSNISDFISSKSNDLQTEHENSKISTSKSSKGGKKKERNDAIIGHISVLIHNISVISNAEKDYSDNLEKELIDPMPG